MVGLAERVDPIVCAHALEAQVRELRLIAAHKPRYNRRSKFPERSVWLKLTVEPFPRLSIVRDRRTDGAPYLGPLRSQRQAEAVRDAIHDAVPLRQCTDRLSLRRVVRAACVLAGIGRCGAPCEGGTSPQQYAALVALVARAWSGDVRPLVEPLERKLAALSDAQRYEQAGVVRDRIATVVRACARMQRLAVAAGDRASSSRRGRTAPAAGSCRWSGPAGWSRPGTRPRGCAAVAGRRRAARDRRRRRRRATPPLAEETECILRWLEEPGTRLVWRQRRRGSMPAFGAGGLRALSRPARPRRGRPVRRPAPAARWTSRAGPP